MPAFHMGSQRHPAGDSVTRVVLPVEIEPSGSASAGGDEILALENQVIDLEIAQTNARADHEGTAYWMIEWRLAVARKRLALAVSRDG